MAVYDEGTIAVSAAVSADTPVDSLTYGLETLAVAAVGAPALSAEHPGEVKTVRARATCALSTVTAAASEGALAVAAAASASLAVDRLGQVSNIGYRVYRSVDGGAFDFDTPWTTSTTLPIVEALAAGHTYRLVTRYRNHYGMESANVNDVTITVAGDSSETPPPPSPPTSIYASAAPQLKYRVMATYAAAPDGDNAATHWIRYEAKRPAHIDWDSDTPAETAMVFMGGLATLIYESDAWEQLDVIEIGVRTRHVTPETPDGADSTNTDVHLVTIGDTQPAVPAFRL